MDVLPLLSLLLVVVLSWPQFLALLGLGAEAPRFSFVLKEPGLPWAYVLSVIGAVALLEVLPYGEELIRGLRANKGSWCRPECLRDKARETVTVDDPAPFDVFRIGQRGA